MKSILNILVLVLCVGAWAQTARAYAPLEEQTYTILPGDTLASIAATHSVSVDDLLQWNGDAAGNLYVGSTLALFSSVEVSQRAHAFYEAKEGETVRGLAKRFELTESQIQVLNPGLPQESTLAMGTLVELLVPVEHRRIGVDYTGEKFRSRIKHPMWLPDQGHGYVVKWKNNTWGTRGTVELLRNAFRHVHYSYPGTAPFVVGDLSRKRGGRFSPHVSHRRGNDVDISYAVKDDEFRTKFTRVNRDTIDAEKTWEFFRRMLETGNVEYMFVDYRLQAELFKVAQASGVSAETLEEVFQYPRGRRHRRGIIRHWRGHANHVHIRFVFHKSLLTERSVEELRRASIQPVVMDLPVWVRGLFRVAS